MVSPALVWLRPPLMQEPIRIEHWITKVTLPGIATSRCHDTDVCFEIVGNLFLFVFTMSLLIIAAF